MTTTPIYSVSTVRPNFDTVAALTADTALSYTEVSGKYYVTSGDKIDAGGFIYEVAASGASDHHLTTAGGVKLYRVSSSLGQSLLQFGAVGDAVTDDSAELQEALDWLADKITNSNNTDATLRLDADRAYKIDSTVSLDVSADSIHGHIDFQGAKIISGVTTGAVIQISSPSKLLRNFHIHDPWIKMSGSEDDGILFTAGTTGATSIYRSSIIRPKIEGVGAGSTGIRLYQNTFEMKIDMPCITSASTAAGTYLIHLDNGSGNVSSVDIYGGTLVGGIHGVYDDSGGIKMFGGTVLQAGSYGASCYNTTSAESAFFGVHFENCQQDAVDNAAIRIDGQGAVVGCYGTANNGNQTVLVRSYASGDGVSIHGNSVDGDTVYVLESTNGAVSGGLIYTDATPSKILTASATQERRISSPSKDAVYNAGTTSGTITMDMDYGNCLEVTLDGNATIAAPLNPMEGQLLRLSIKQDGTGGHSVTFNSAFIAPTAAGTAANDRSEYTFQHTDGSWRQISYFLTT